jgi:hypothetical protein
MDEVEAGAAVVMCYKCHNTGLTYKRKLQIMLATHQVRPMCAHQHLQDSPKPQPVVETMDADVDVGIATMQHSYDHSSL